MILSALAWWIGACITAEAAETAALQRVGDAFGFFLPATEPQSL
jgi:hypothetical protein